MATTEEKINLAEKSKDFLNWLGEWYANLKPIPLSAAITEPARTALCSVDMLEGFCFEGTLSSPHLAACIQPIANLFQRTYERGVRNFVSIQEWHSEHAEEFKAYGKHCVRGTRASELVRELQSLPFARNIEIVHKNSLHTIVGTTME